MMTSRYSTRKKGARWRKSRRECVSDQNVCLPTAQERMFQDIIGEGGRNSIQKKRDSSRRRFERKAKTHLLHTEEMEVVVARGMVEGCEFLGGEVKPTSGGSQSFSQRSKHSAPVILVGGNSPEAIQSFMLKLFEIGFPTCGPQSDFLSSDFINMVVNGEAASLGGCAVAVPSDYNFEHDFPYDTGRCVALWIDSSMSSCASGASALCYNWLRKAAQGRLMRIPSSAAEEWKSQLRAVSRFLNYQLPEC